MLTFAVKNNKNEKNDIPCILAFQSVYANLQVGVRQPTSRCTPTYKSVYANLHIGVRQLKVGIMGLFY